MPHATVQSHGAAVSAPRPGSEGALATVAAGIWGEEARAGMLLEMPELDLL